MVRWLLVFGALALVWAGLAQTAPAGAQDDAGGAVVLILDASGSMERTDDSGVVLMDGAKDAVSRLVEGLPEGSPVGLLLYGHRAPNDDPAAGCMDTELVVPVGPLERDAMLATISGVAPRGFTPIGRALEEAAAALGDAGGTVILVSDGEDTCAPPDPCEIAAALSDAGIDLRVHTIGFFLDQEGAAQQQLQCIAETTGGSYQNVDTIDELAGELGLLVATALPPGPEPLILPLDGALTQELAPVVPIGDLRAPNGVAQVTLGGTIGPGQTRWYSFEVADPTGLAVTVSADRLTPGAGPEDTARVEIVDAAGYRYDTGPSRFGLPEVVLAEHSPPVWMGTTASFSGYDVFWHELAGEEQAFVEYLGFDAESYDAAMVEMLTRPAPPQIAGGSYYIGVTWEADPGQGERELLVDLQAWEGAEVKHLVYEELPGGPDPETAPTLEPPDAMASWLPATPEEATLRGGYVAPIEAGETLWYRLMPSTEATLNLRAFLNRPAGAAEEGSFSVEIHDAEGAPVGTLREGYEASAALDDPAGFDNFQVPAALASRPLVGVAATGADGARYISLQWEGPAGESAEVEFVVDVLGDLEATPEEVNPETTPDDRDAPLDEAADEQEAVVANTDGGGSSLGLIIAIAAAGVVIAIAIGFLVRRLRHPS